MDAGPQPEQVYAKDAANNLASRAGINPLHVTRTISVTDKDLNFLQDLSDRLGHEAQKFNRIKAGFSKAPDRGFDFYGIHFMSNSKYSENREIDKTDLDRNLNAVRLAAEKSDFVIVYLHHHHWENDWERSPEWVSLIARLSIDAGANVFVSHGIPLLHGIEIYRNRPIFYSLGNFIYHTQRPKERSGDDRLWQSVIADCNFDSKGNLKSMDLIPIILGGESALLKRDYRNRQAPHLAGENFGRTILENVKRLSGKFGTTLSVKNGRGYLSMAVE